jgi:hypothetical protein
MDAEEICKRWKSTASRRWSIEVAVTWSLSSACPSCDRGKEEDDFLL